jgi:mannose/cellobiose epimerase-like protein (N-acyl-D-glucosamine 2-epimerase family)
MIRKLAAALLLLLSACATQPRAPHDLPRGEVWVAHLERDLAPFWTTPEALGNPTGNFPTFRCDDGRRWNPAQPCEELTQAGTWISDNLDREYLRMQSRQTYFYGVAYHLTGDPKMLALAKAGAQWIRTRGLDRPNGGAVSWWKHGVADAPPSLRTTQDLAYAQLGLAMTYYLTRDPELLADIVALKQHIFRAYDDREGLLLWVLEGEDAQRRELVAQLDQINAYMLLLAPILPEPHRKEWMRDLERLADGMVARYWSPELGMFRGTIHDPAHSGLGTRHTDFGHTIKALWMIERVGRVTHRDDLVAFATKNAPRVLDRAWIADTGCWATGFREDGSLDRTLVWWSFAELDQTSATLALHDASHASRLPASARCWFEKITDREHHEVWGFVDPDDPSRHFAKAHLWKNGYHSAEHALVGYLTSQELHAEQAQLWFAFDATRATARPYVFDGRAVRVEKRANGTRVTFTRLR